MKRMCERDVDMTLPANRVDRPSEDPVSNVLKWVLLAVAVGTFGLMAWATSATYQASPPQPDRFVAADGTVLMTAEDIAAGKAGFQKADLMDYGSLYGMGSYYGEDYTASILVSLAESTRYDIAMARFGKDVVALRKHRSCLRAEPMCRIGWHRLGLLPQNGRSGQIGQQHRVLVLRDRLRGRLRIVSRMHGSSTLS